MMPVACGITGAISVALVRPVSSVESVTGWAASVTKPTSGGPGGGGGLAPQAESARTSAEIDSGRLIAAREGMRNRGLLVGCSPQGGNGHSLIVRRTTERQAPRGIGALPDVALCNDV